MVENQSHFENLDAAREYVDDVRQHFQDEDAAYRGQRNKEQQLIAEVISDEAKDFLDGTMAGILAVTSSGLVEMPRDYETEVGKAAYSWGEFRNQYQRLMVAFSIITNRLHRDGFQVESLSQMPKEDWEKVASVLLTDFLEHNALRFGVISAGIQETDIKTIHTDDGGVRRNVTYRDKDKARNEKEIDHNMTERDYVSHVGGQPATHIAGKMSPAEYRSLREEFPEIDKDTFDRVVGFYTNARKELETKYGS